MDDSLPRSGGSLGSNFPFCFRKTPSLDPLTGTRLQFRVLIMQKSENLAVDFFCDFVSRSGLNMETMPLWGNLKNAMPLLPQTLKGKKSGMDRSCRGGDRSKEEARRRGGGRNRRKNAPFFRFFRFGGRHPSAKSFFPPPLPPYILAVNPRKRRKNKEEGALLLLLLYPRIATYAAAVVRRFPPSFPSYSAGKRGAEKEKKSFHFLPLDPPPPSPSVQNGPAWPARPSHAGNEIMFSADRGLIGPDSLLFLHRDR